MHEANSFITLTYDDEHFAPSLNYKDFQLFMRRLRKARGKVRFFCCGEYGDKFGRAHFHALLFGVTFARDRTIGDELYESNELSKLWPAGMSSFGDVTFQSAGYVARYAHKKITGPMAKEHYERVDLSTGEVIDVVPEFGHMSLKPGIGRPWFDRFWRDVYLARDGCVVNGKVLPSPRYYDTLLESRDPLLSTDKEFDRYVNSEQFKDDCTIERLAVREQVTKARLSFNDKRKQ